MTTSRTHKSQEPCTATLRVEGIVQGVGFRPFVYRLAQREGIGGWVRNDGQGVTIRLVAELDCIERFVEAIKREAPPAALVERVIWLDRKPGGKTGGQFRIVGSESSSAKGTLISPDIALCADCLREMHDPANRRHRYPFINCTNCGPRFSIIESLPYDRPRTTMHAFQMCPACQAEYDDPMDRRFHAQPNACQACGPHLELWDPQGTLLAGRDDALRAAADAVRQGRVVALKGLGGFHLLVDARNEEAVALLRQRKQREEKPFALMVPTLEVARALCHVDDAAALLLASPAAPIVLLRRRDGSTSRPSRPFRRNGPTQAANPSADTAARDAIDAPVAPNVAPANPYLGLMLPYTPLHCLMMEELCFPVVATSGNLSDEPICTDEREALERLSGIADVFLVHNRPIARHVDDSVARVLAGEAQVVRCARGYAPLPVALPAGAPALLAVGAHLKNTIAISVGTGESPRAFISQHIGDLETPQAFDAFRRVIGTLEQLYEHRPQTVVCDLHPSYMSTQHARSTGLQVVAVQHHYAHVLACMAEHRIEGPVLGISWDGTGYGTDGTIWGGEFLRVTDDGFERVGHLRCFPLPGGEKAVREPRRTALGVLYEAFGVGVQRFEDLPALQALSAAAVPILLGMLEKRVNCPRTSSIGRLFDAVSSLCGIRQVVNYEGQGAMELEFAMGWQGPGPDSPKASLVPRYDCVLSQDATAGPLVTDWEPMLVELISDVRRSAPTGEISLKFHNSLVEAAMNVVIRIGEKKVVLTGGCFQNAYLASRLICRLRAEGFDPYWHRRVPTNDNGIALGQLMAASVAAKRQRKSKE